KTEEELIKSASLYGWTKSNKKRFSRRVGVIDWYGYDGISQYQCPDCLQKWDRWTGNPIKKVSFDFDDTLNTESVASFAKWCIEQGYEVWVVTTRLPDHEAPNASSNKDLWEIVESLGISFSCVIFMEMVPKFEFFKEKENQDFIFHLDNDPDEIAAIKLHCPSIEAVNHIERTDWKDYLIDYLS
ncbi:MAG: hypothetical protein ABJG33_08975, partial [Balneola sp.]